MVLPPPRIEAAIVPSPLTEEEKEWLEGQVQGITDPDLKTYLEKLGESICR